MPLGNLPDGVYADGGRDESAIPDDHRATGWQRIIRDGVSVQVPTGTEEMPAQTIPADVLSAAAALATVVGTLNAEYPGLELDPSDGYEATYAAIFEGVVPAADQARVWARVDTAYRTLEYHTAKWQSGASTWDMLATLQDALSQSSQ